MRDLLLLATVFAAAPFSVSAAQQSARPQRQDSAYTAKIHEYLQDPRITTELVDHLPASSTVPTPLKFLGKIVGTPGELTHARDIHRYMEAVARAAPNRARFWTIGKTEEGRDMVLLAIADEQTIKQLDRYKGMLNALTDPRKTTEADAPPEPQVPLKLGQKDLTDQEALQKTEDLRKKIVAGAKFQLEVLDFEQRHERVS